MRKTKLEKGITLVALIITIVVLLILAVVSIGAVRNSGIIGHATNASDTWKQAQANEASYLEGYEDKIKSMLPPEPISKEKSYVGCYADVDGDGIADGIIYADLAIGGEGEFTSTEGGSYTINKKDNLNNYYIKEEEHEENSFGKRALIAAIDKNEDDFRFYVMALNDIYGNTLPLCNIDNEVLENLNFSNDFGMGKSNTSLLETYDINSNPNLWNYINDYVKKGWFIPSVGEWSAFANELENYGMLYNWSSSINKEGKGYAIMVYGGSGEILTDRAYKEARIRLSTRF